MGYFGPADKDPGTGGCQPKGLGGVFQGGGTVGADFWFEDVVDDPPHGTGPGKLSTQGCKADNGDTDEDTGLGGLVISTTGVSNRGDGI